MCPRSVSNAPRCPDPQELAAAVMSRTPLPHVRQCPQCADVAAQFRGLESALETLRDDVFDPAISVRPSRLRARNAAVVATAALVVVAVTVRLLTTVTPITLSSTGWRGEVRAMEVAVENLDDGQLQFGFAPVRNAAFHVVVLFGADGQVVQRRVVPGDCACVVAIDVPSGHAGETWFWKVEAISAESAALATAIGIASHGQDR